MITIAHVSDLHFHTDQDDNRDAIALLKKVKSAFNNADGMHQLLVTGDIVDDGDIEQFGNATAALKPFMDHLLVAPGNHDYGYAGNIYSDDSAQLFDNSFLPTIGVSDKFALKQPVTHLLDDGAGTQLLTVGLNSVLETENPLDFARGAIGKQQLSQLNDILSKAVYENIPKLVYLHHRPQKCSWFLELVDAEDLMAVINQNNVSIMAFGHSGGSMKAEESHQAQIMNIIRKQYGVRYFLNANSCVDAQKYYEICVSGGNVAVAIR